MPIQLETLQNAPALAYKALRLIDPADRYTYQDRILALGTFRIIENETAVSPIVAAYLRELSQYSGQYDNELSARRAAAAKQTEPVDWSPFSRQEEAFRQQLAQRCVLTFADFQRYLKHEQTETKYHDDNDPQWLKGAEQVRAFARQRFATLQRQGGFSPSFAGYRQYLKAA